MRIEELRTFVTVVEAGGVTSAAAKLGVAQSTTSDRINSLENYLKTPLFDRCASSSLVKLTAEGKRLLPTARKVVALADELEALCAQPSTERSPTVRLGVNESVAHTWLFSWLARLRAEQPCLTFDITVETTDALEKLMAKGRLDVVAAARGFADTRIKKQRLTPLEMAFVGHGKRHAKAEYELSDLAREGFVTFSSDTQPHSQLVKLLARQGIRACRIDRLSSISAIAMAVEAGLGVATLPRRVVDSAAQSAKLRILPCKHGLTPLPLWLSWRVSEDRNSAEMRASLFSFLEDESWLKVSAVRQARSSRETTL